MLFKILSIAHGWFTIDINRQFTLTNSDFMGCDAPALLLEAISSLLEYPEAERWLCWQDEPGAYIVQMERCDERLFLRIFDTEKESMNLEYSGDSLSSHITKCRYKTEENVIKAAKCIFEEFALYEDGYGRGRYVGHWGEFPQAAYNRLKELLRVNKYREQ